MIPCTLQTHSIGIDNMYSRICKEVGLDKKDMVFPIFVQEPGMEIHCIDAMPEMTITPLSETISQVQKVLDAGISSIIIFGIPKQRDRGASYASKKNGIVQRALLLIKGNFGKSVNVTTDVCLCQYNFSGHCGVFKDNAKIDNDSTLHILSDIATSHAEAGADIVAPSSMMDGQVLSIRRSLDKHGFKNTKILSYSAKYHSSLYTPFRSATFSNKCNYNKLNKSSYQIAYTNPKETMREIECDIREGADMVMIKPSMAYLDVIYMIKKIFKFPLAVQNVSGEYAMVKAAGRRGWIEEEEAKVNSIVSIKRAGADRIVSYFAMDIARYLD
jgi:porphobilinogen synthase